MASPVCQMIRPVSNLNLFLWLALLVGVFVAVPLANIIFAIVLILSWGT